MGYGLTWPIGLTGITPTAGWFGMEDGTGGGGTLAGIFGTIKDGFLLICANCSAVGGGCCEGMMAPVEVLTGMTCGE